MRGGAGGPEAGQRRQPGPVLPLRVRERHVSARLRQHPGCHPVLEPVAAGKGRGRAAFHTQLEMGKVRSELQPLKSR